MAQILRLVSQSVRTNPLLKNSVLANESMQSKRFILSYFGFGKEKAVVGPDVPDKDIRLPDPIEHATGAERLVLMAAEKGIHDPFDMLPSPRGPGTKEDPNLVPSFEDRRLIGCVCEEDQTHVCYMWIHKDDPRRCECGYWFKWVPARKFWEEIDTSFGK